MEGKKNWVWGRLSKRVAQDARSPSRKGSSNSKLPCAVLRTGGVMRNRGVPVLGAFTFRVLHCPSLSQLETETQ
jgi:hypothetical protein